MRRACVAAAVLVFLGPGGAAVAAPPFDGPAFEGPAGRFVTAAPPVPAPAVPFSDGDGVEHRLTDYRGKVVLLNFWATWCPACVVEMPALDRLQGKLGGDGFAVIAVSQDAAGAAVVRRFLGMHTLDRISVFLDDQRRLGVAFGQDMLPTSILLDADGREVGRLVGPAEWDSPQALTLIRHVMHRGGDGAVQAPGGASDPAVRPR